MMKNKDKKKNISLKKIVIFSFCFLIVFVSFLHPVFAQYQNQEKIPGADQTDSFITYLQQIINFGFAVIGILALFMLIIGAYQYLIAAGTGNVADAKETITSALLGLILGLCAYIILYKINPDLVNFRSITQITGGAISSGTPVVGAVGTYTAIKPSGDRATATMAWIDNGIPPLNSGLGQGDP